MQIDNSPLISVIITCYNDGQFVRQAIESVITQTYSNLEILVVNDGSTDNTRSEILAVIDARTKLIDQKNKGVIKARNEAIKISKGDFFVPLDGDDFLEPSFIEKALYVLLTKKAVGIVSSYCRMFYPDKSTEIWKEQKLDLTDFLVRNRIVSTALIRKKCWIEVGGYDEIMKGGYEDYEFFISILSKGWRVHKIEEILFNYRKGKLQSRDANADKISSELKKIILKKHSELFLSNFDSVLIGLIKENERLKSENNFLKNSYSYIIGNKILLFFKYFGFSRK